MASMKVTVEHTHAFLLIVMGLSIVVFTITAQQPKSTGCQTQNNPNTSPSIKGYNSGFFLSLSMFVWMKYAAFWFFMSGTLLWSVRVTVDSAAEEESRAASEEDKDYRAAREKHESALGAVKTASAAYTDAKLNATDAQIEQAEDHFQQSIAMMNRAAKEMEAKKPASGMERVHWKKLTRIMFCASLLFCVGGAICANISFFLSLASEIGCVEKAAYHIPYASPAILVAAICTRFFIVGISAL